MTNYSNVVFGESAPVLDEQLLHPDRCDLFWDTVNGGSDMRGAMSNHIFPTYLSTGFHDIFNRGTHDMWLSMTEETRSKSALIIHPYHQRPIINPTISPMVRSMSYVPITRENG